MHDRAREMEQASMYSTAARPRIEECGRRQEGGTKGWRERGQVGTSDVLLQFDWDPGSPGMHKVWLHVSSRYIDRIGHREKKNVSQMWK